MKARSKIGIAIASLLASCGVAVPAIAGPPLFMYSRPVRLTPQQCVSKAYQVLRNRSLGVAHDTDTFSSDNVFAFGQNDQATIIVDCSEASSIGKVLVMVAAYDDSTANSYARGIADAISQ